MPKVSIIITAYLEQSKPYLDLCLDSIASLSYPEDLLQIIIVSPYLAGLGTAYTVINAPSKNNAHALNIGASHVHKDSQYLLFCNDDVIFTKKSLTQLIANSQSMGDHGVFMPIGNDQQMRYILPIPGSPAGPWRIGQEGIDIGYLKYWNSPYQTGMILCESLCLYAVLVPRPVWELVGEYDERGWQDDIDYTKRVRQAGLVNAICLSALVYHAGGVSADVTLNAKARAESIAIHQEKWGNNESMP